MDDAYSIYVTCFELETQKKKDLVMSTYGSLYSRMDQVKPVEASL